MPVQRGEDIIIGVGLEDPSNRGTKVAPQVFIPGRVPTKLAVVMNKKLVKETRGSKLASAGSEAVMKHAAGDLEFNLRVKSIPYILKSLLGKLESAPKDGDAAVGVHTATVLPENPQHPALTAAVHQPQLTDYSYPLALISALGIKLVPDDLVVATVGIIAKDEVAEDDAFEPTFDENDVYFRHQDVTIKIAENAASLDAGDTLLVKELTLNLANGARVDQNVSEFNPGNVIATTMSPTGSFKLDMDDEELRDVYVGGENRAIRITMVRSDITIGSASHPKITITLPVCTIEKWSPDRPIDEVVRQGIDFTVHANPDGEPVTIVVENDQADYLSAAEEES